MLRSRRFLASALVVSLLVLGCCWALASPIGSSPDDDFHLSSIWCSSTAPDDLCAPGSAPAGRPSAEGERAVVVPALVSGKAACYAFHPETSASCQGSIREDSRAVSRANDGMYPGGYYTLMGFLASSHPVESALAMRGVAWILAIGVIMAAAAVASANLRRTYVVAVLATSIPLGIFLFASNNPSGPVVASVGAFWCAALTWFEPTSRPRQVAAGLLAVAAAALALVSRADAGLYIATAAGCAAVLSQGWRRERWGRTAALSGVALIGLLVLLSAGQTDIATTEELVSGGRRTWTDVLWFNLLNLPVVWTGSFGDGVRGLGWLDTQMPAIVDTTLIATAGALAFWSITRWDRIQGVSVAIATIPLTVFPLMVLHSKNALANEWIQPRYLLPMLPVVLGIMLLPRRDEPTSWLSTRQVVLLGVLLTTAHTFALHANIRRYVTGQDVLGANLDASVEWWWDIPFRPMLLWATGSVALGAVVAISLVLVHRTVTPVSDPPGGRGHSAGIPAPAGGLQRPRTEAPG